MRQGAIRVFRGRHACRRSAPGASRYRSPPRDPVSSRTGERWRHPPRSADAGGAPSGSSVRQAPEKDARQVEASAGCGACEAGKVSVEASAILTVSGACDSTTAGLDRDGFVALPANRSAVNANNADCDSDPVISRCGREGAWDAACRRAAESAQADFANFQRRIHSLQRADARYRIRFATSNICARIHRSRRDPTPFTPFTPCEACSFIGPGERDSKRAGRGTGKAAMDRPYCSLSRTSSRETRTA